MSLGGRSKAVVFSDNDHAVVGICWPLTIIPVRMSAIPESFSLGSLCRWAISTLLWLDQTSWDIPLFLDQFAWDCEHEALRKFPTPAQFCPPCNISLENRRRKAYLLDQPKETMMRNPFIILRSWAFRTSGPHATMQSPAMSLCSRFLSPRASNGEVDGSFR